MMLPLKISGIGVHFPEQRETKDDFIRRGVPEDVIEKLGVYERRVVTKGQTAADLELEAAKKALENAGMTAGDIDLIIGITVLPEKIGMPNSNLLQHRIGAINAAAFDMVQACGAVIPAMLTASGFLAQGIYQRILITTSTHWSVISDAAHPSSDFPLGDGAAAVVVTASGSDYGIIASDMQTVGRYYSHCGIGVHDRSVKYYDEHHGKLLFYLDKSGVDGSATEFNDYLVAALPKTFNAAMKKACLKTTDIDCAVIHGNVKPLADAWIHGMGISPDRFPLTYRRYGNLSASTILVNLREGLRSGMIKNGHTLALVSGGAGFSAGTIIMRWEGNDASI